MLGHLRLCARTGVGWSCNLPNCYDLPPQDDREQLAQLAFEGFNVTGLFFADQTLLSLYSVGKSTGVVVDFGHTKTGA